MNTTTDELAKVPTLANGYRFQWEPAQDSHVILYPEGMKVLSGSAAEIVQLFDGERTVADIVSALEQKFPDVELQQDVLDFVAGASQEGWLNV